MCNVYVPVPHPHLMPAHFRLTATMTQVLYTESEAVPPNFIAIGDSVMQSNPAYGFGATKACVGAVTLAGLLAKARSTELPPSFATLFFRKQHKRTRWMWDGAKMSDYLFDSTEPCEGEKKEGNTMVPTKMLLSWFRVCERVGQSVHYSRTFLLSHCYRTL